jgi:hypothetical protein
MVFETIAYTDFATPALLPGESIELTGLAGG